MNVQSTAIAENKAAFIVDEAIKKRAIELIRSIDREARREDPH